MHTYTATHMILKLKILLLFESFFTVTLFLYVYTSPLIKLQTIITLKPIFRCHFSIHQ